MPEQSSGMLPKTHAANSRQSSENNQNHPHQLHYYSSTLKYSNQNQNQSKTAVFSKTNFPHYSSNHRTPEKLSFSSKQRATSTNFTPPKPSISTNLSLSRQLAKPISSNALSIRQIDVHEESSEEISYSDNQNQNGIVDNNSLSSSQIPSDYFYDAREVQFDSDLDEVLEKNEQATYFRARSNNFQNEEITT